MLTHDCCGETLHLHADRALYWPRRRMLIVADVHLGKAAAFRSHGIPIPRGTTQKNLQRLRPFLARVTRCAMYGHYSVGLELAYAASRGAMLDASPMLY